MHGNCKAQHETPGGQLVDYETGDRVEIRLFGAWRSGEIVRTETVCGEYQREVELDNRILGVGERVVVLVTYDGLVYGRQWCIPEAYMPDVDDYEASLIGNTAIRFAE